MLLDDIASDRTNREVVQNINFPKLNENASSAQIKEAVMFAVQKIQEHPTASPIRMKYRLILEQTLCETQQLIKNGKIPMKELNELRTWMNAVSEAPQLKESVDQAEVLVAAKSLGNDLQTMYEKAAKMMTTDLVHIAEEVKNKFGQSEAEEYYRIMQQSLNETVTQLQTAYELANQAAHSLSTGEPVDMGGDMATDEFDELSADEEPAAEVSDLDTGGRDLKSDF